MTGEREVAPPKFRVDRAVPLGRHPLLAVFPGLDRLSTARRQEPDSQRRRKLFEDTCVEIVGTEDWMYVSPRKAPRGSERGWRPVVAGETDCIVIGEQHLRTSSELILFLDIFHELCHIRQRWDGRELWDRRYSYGRRPTEVEAYRFVVEEARRLGVGDETLRDYLRVEWIDDDDFGHLLDAVGVPRA
jgi:hypothetical protein